MTWYAVKKLAAVDRALDQGSAYCSALVTAAVYICTLWRPWVITELPSPESVLEVDLVCNKKELPKNAIYRIASISFPAPRLDRVTVTT